MWVHLCSRFAQQSEARRQDLLLETPADGFAEHALQGNWWVFMLTFLLTLTIGVVVSLPDRVCAISSVCKQDFTASTCLLNQS